MYTGDTVPVRVRTYSYCSVRCDEREEDDRDEHDVVSDVSLNQYHTLWDCIIINYLSFKKSIVVKFVTCEKFAD